MKYWVLHDFGNEGGYRICGEADTLAAAVDIRESKLVQAGATAIIVEVLDILKAYRAAADEKYGHVPASVRTSIAMDIPDVVTVPSMKPNPDYDPRLAAVNRFTTNQLQSRWTSNPE